MTESTFAIGVDLGGTKIAYALVDRNGQIQEELRQPTDAAVRWETVVSQIIEGVKAITAKTGITPAGIGVGVAGQVDRKTGAVRFAPNLRWHEKPLRAVLEDALQVQVRVDNDVRTATWGEWLYGAGKDCDDLICVFVGTGIGGGIVSGGQMLHGCSNTAGEIGHITVDLHGPLCTCGNQGCMEALAGGWAIAKRARNIVISHPELGAGISMLTNDRIEDITAVEVLRAYRAHDPLAKVLIREVVEALVAGVASLVSMVNPCRIILGGGIVGGLPELVERVDRGVRYRTLSAASEPLRVFAAQLGDQAGVVGAAAMAMQSVKKGQSGH